MYNKLQRCTVYKILFLLRPGFALVYGCWERITKTVRRVLVCVHAFAILRFVKASENVTCFRYVNWLI